MNNTAEGAEKIKMLKKQDSHNPLTSSIKILNHHT